MGMCMSTKNISVMDDAYDLLVKKRRKGESFSSVIRRITTKKSDIMTFAGAWKNISDEEANQIKEDIANLRKKSSKELMEKLKRYDRH